MQDFKDRARKRQHIAPRQKKLNIQYKPKGKLRISSQRKHRYTYPRTVQGTRFSPSFSVASPKDFIYSWYKPFLGLGTFALVCWILIGLIWQSFSFFQYPQPHQLHIEGYAALSPPTIYDLTGISATKSFAEVDTYQVANNLKQHPRIEQVQIRKLFPNFLSIALKERRPYAYLRAEEAYYLIDLTLHPIQKVPASEASPHPVLTGLAQAEVQLGKPIVSMALQKGTQFLDMIRNSSMDWSNLAELNVEDPLNLKIKLRQPPVLFQLGQGSYLEKMKTYEKIAAQLQQANKPLHSIDLRYKNKAIVQF